MKTNEMKNRIQSLIRRHEGFTLVELIVVIAILAILAGVAVPAYSGYVEKANLSADQTLLSAVNTAFAAACVDNEADIYTIDLAKGAPTLEWREDLTIENVVYGADDAEKAAYAESFKLFYEGNEDAAFTEKRAVMFDALKRMFVMADDVSSVTLSYKGSYIEVSTEALAAINNSTFGEMGSEALLGQVGFVADLTGALLSEGQEDLVALVDEEYFAELQSSLGITTEEWVTMVQSGLDVNKFMANSLVLSAAQNTDSMDTDAVLKSLSEGNMTVKLSSEKDLGELAMTYALYTAYAEKNNLPTTGVTGLTTLNDALGTKEFKEYAGSDQAKTDLAGYLAAMDVVGDASGNQQAALDLLTNGFTDEELKALMGSAMGN